jgi:hypothetical protein
MAINLDPKQVVSFEELLMSQRGVFGDGEGSGSGDEEKEESKWLRKFVKVRGKRFCIFSPKYIRLGLKEHKHEAY